MSQTIFFPADRERMSPHVVVQIGCGGGCKGSSGVAPPAVRPRGPSAEPRRLRPARAPSCGTQALMPGHQPLPCGVKVPARDGSGNAASDWLRSMAQAVALGGGEAPGGYLGAKGSGVLS